MELAINTDIQEIQETDTDFYEGIYGDMATYVILTDGLLRIAFSKNESGDIFVTKKEFYPDFKYVKTFPGQFIAYEYDFSILEKDYPKN